MTNPKLIATAFAENGDKNIIPESVGANPQNATMQAGFPPITQQKISEGGVPPERADFNGILNLYGQHVVHLNKGLPYEFDADFAALIGGYPKHARVMLTNGDIVKSTVDSNTNDPNVNMTEWEYSSLTPSNNLSDVADKPVARTNLDVYSKAETDSIAGTPNATETVAGKAKIATTAIAQAGTNDTNIITPKKLKGYLDNKVLGINQTWQDVTTSRSSATTYTNSSTAPIMLSIAVRDSGGGGAVILYVSGSIVIRLEDLSGGSVGYIQIVAIVPAGQTYRLDASNNPITFWTELR